MKSLMVAAAESQPRLRFRCRKSELVRSARRRRVCQFWKIDIVWTAERRGERERTIEWHCVWEGRVCGGGVACVTRRRGRESRSIDCSDDWRSALKRSDIQTARISSIKNAVEIFTNYKSFMFPDNLLRYRWTEFRQLARFELWAGFRLARVKIKSGLRRAWVKIWSGFGLLLGETRIWSRASIG